jgi:spore coat-associated protein N
MTIKKKLGLGVASAALGLSLIGGGSWAAFNDTATINNHFAAGTLDLSVGHVNAGPNFDLGNMKPGDSVKRLFTLNNVGSLAIKEVLLNVTANNFLDNGVVSADNTKLLDYLSQFEVDVFRADHETKNNVDPSDDRWEPTDSIVASGQTLTLANLVDGSYVSKIKSDYLGKDGSNRINLASLVVAPGSEAYRGIPVTPVDSDGVLMEITFKNDLNKKTDGSGEYVQNKFQNDSADFYFNLEATQWEGVNLDSSNGNGSINNGVQGTPSPKSIGTGKYNGNEVVDSNGDNRN